MDIREQLLKLYVYDPENGDKLDNRLLNLRSVTRSQNVMNSKKRKNCSSNLKGVCKKADRKNRWSAEITCEGGVVRLGIFDCPAAAHFAYCVAAETLFKEYARLA